MAAGIKRSCVRSHRITDEEARAFLASDEVSFVSGSYHTEDGGFLHIAGTFQRL